MKEESHNNFIENDISFNILMNKRKKFEIYAVCIYFNNSFLHRLFKKHKFSVVVLSTSYEDAEKYKKLYSDYFHAFCKKISCEIMKLKSPFLISEKVMIIESPEEISI